jgi:hypothetical protein
LKGVTVIGVRDRCVWEAFEVEGVVESVLHSILAC